MNYLGSKLSKRATWIILFTLLSCLTRWRLCIKATLIMDLFTLKFYVCLGMKRSFSLNKIMNSIWSCFIFISEIMPTKRNTYLPYTFAEIAVKYVIIGVIISAMLCRISEGYLIFHWISTEKQMSRWGQTCYDKYWTVGGSRRLIISRRLERRLVIVWLIIRVLFDVNLVSNTTYLSHPFDLTCCMQKLLGWWKW